MTLEEWLNTQTQTLSEGVDADDIWNASRLNLPTCETCEYWKAAKGGWGTCKNEMVSQNVWEPPVNIEIFGELFGCIYHSEIEKLREKDE